MMQSVYLNKKLKHPVEKVFRAFSKPELVLQWFGPINMKTVHVEMDFQVGGMYAYKVEKPDGNTFWIKGEYLSIVSNSKIEFSSYYEGLSAAISKPSRVTIQLEEQEEGTFLSLSQSFKEVPANMEGRTKSWELMFMRMNQLIS
jgi:uncharacterized protein YndB with AHSA1/START domain